MNSVEIKLKIFLIWIYVALAIFQGNTVYIFLTKSNQVVIIISLVVLALIVGISGKIEIQRKTKRVLLLYLVLDVVILSLINYSTPSMFFLTLSFSLLLIVFQSRENIILFLKVLSDQIFVIAFISLLFWLLTNIFGVIHASRIYSQGAIPWGHNVYATVHNIYFYINNYIVQKNIIGAVFANTAIFTEGPMYAYLLVIALFYEMNFNEKPNKYKMIVIMITSFTVFSDNAYIGVFFCIAFYWYLHHGNSSLRSFIIIAMVLVMGIAVVSMILYQKSIVKNASFQIRLDDMLANLRAFIHHPLLGVGFNNARGLDVYRNRAYIVNASNSSGFLGILAYGGLLWGIWYIIPFIKAIIDILQTHQNYFDRMMNGFIILTTILLLNVSIHDRIISFIICAISWGYILNKKNTETYFIDGGDKSLCKK